MQKSIEKLFSKSMVVTFAILMGLGLGFASLGSLGDNSAFAESVSSGSSDVTVRVKDIITLRILDSTASSEIDNLSLGLTPTPNGTFTKGSFNVDASTSNATGYKLYMTSIGTNPVNNTNSSSSSSSSDSSSNPSFSSSSSSSNSSTAAYTTDLINIDNTISDSIPTLVTGAGVTEADFRVRNSPYKNKWGYSLNGLSISNSTDPTTGAIVHTTIENTDTSAITYTNIPSHNTNHEVGGSNSAVESDLTPVTIGVNVSNSVASGTYKNALEFTAIANELPTEYSLKFNANLDGAGLDTEEARTAYHVEDMLDNLEAESYASSYSFTLPSGADNIPIKTNMVLREWNTRADGSGVSYQPGDSLELIVDDTDPYSTEATLYAIWTNDFFHLTYMQDMYPTVCAKVTTPSADVKNITSATEIANHTDTDGSHKGDTSYVAQRTLYDIRDYPANQYTIRKLADGNCWMVTNLKLALSTSSSVAVVENATGKLAPATPTSATQQGAIDSNGMWTPTGAGGTSNAATPMNGNTKYVSTYDSWYYNWYAATAGSGTYSMVTSSGDVPYSICPAGWRLPTNYVNPVYPDGGASKSYGMLTKEYLGITGNTSTSTGYQTLQSFPLSFPRVGWTRAGSLDNNSSGYYWSSVASSSASHNARNLVIRASIVNPQYDGYKYAGFSIRCVTI